MGPAVQFGWTTLQKNSLFVIGTNAAAMVVPMLIVGMGHMMLHREGQNFAVLLISVAVQATFTLGLFKIYLRYRDGETPILENLIDGVQRFYVLMGASIVASFAVVIGLVLFLLPGIVVLLRLMFVGFVIVDERVGPIDAIQRSWDITRGHTLDLFLFYILLCGVNLLGAACLLVGLLVSIPITGLALAYVYRVLKPRAALAAPVAPTS